MNDIEIPASTLLMMKDIPVMKFNFDLAEYKILREDLLPFQLKGRFRKVLDFSEVHTRYDDSQRQIAIRKNSEALISWFDGRVLPLSRENAKKIYNLFGFAQLQDEYSRAKIAIVCRALSLLDNYWIKSENDKITWNEVDLHKVHLNEVIAQVSLRGTSLSIQNKEQEALRCPELSGQGAYAKAWLRESDGLYLHKTGNRGITESKIEVMVSNILDNCNVDHLKYEAADAFDGYTCKCKCMTNDEISILPGMDFISFCLRQQKDPMTEMLSVDAENIYKMMIVDYLIANPDRHGMNWGFFYKCDTLKIIGCHPLYDHNNSFDINYMQDPDVRYLFEESKSMREWAKFAMTKVDFHFYKEFTRDDFITDRQYKCFSERAKELGVKVIPDSVNKNKSILKR